MSKRISATAALGLSVVAFIYSDFALSQLIEPNGISFVLGSLAPIVLVLARSGAAHWSESTLALGVPLGLLGGTIGVTNLSAHMNDYSAAYPATSIMLLTVLYGGIISALGYFAKDKAEKQNNRLTKTSMAIALAPFVFLVCYTFVNFGISPFLSLEALSVFFAVFASQLLLGRRFSFQRLTECGLFAAILCLIIGLIQWYGAGELDRDAINLAINGLNYGLIIYIFAYMISRLKGDTESNKIETGRANWHWMEVTAFMVFMLFAPETLRETLMSAQDAVALVEETALLEQRLASLEQRISDIEKQ